MTMEKSKTEKALRLIATEGISAKEAAERVGISRAAVSKGKLWPSKSTQNIKCTIDSCRFKCYRINQLVSHLNNMHDQHIVFEDHIFSGAEDLKQWKDNLEEETPCRFRRQKGMKSGVTYYSCTRSSSIRTIRTQPSYQRKRYLKVHRCDISRPIARGILTNGLPDLI